jgi:phage anti-repressor protein
MKSNHSSEYSRMKFCYKFLFSKKVSEQNSRAEQQSCHIKLNNAKELAKIRTTEESFQVLWKSKQSKILSIRIS